MRVIYVQANQLIILYEHINHFIKMRCFNNTTGVEDIECDIDAKTVTVSCGDEADEQLMLEKLLKWSEASGKSVSLISADK